MSNKNAIILGVGLADNITRPLQQLSNRLRNQGRQLSATGSELTGAFTYAVVGASAALLKFAGDLDAMKQGLAVTMGSVQAASAEFAKLKKTAEIPGVGLQDALKGSLNLQALGASADQARYIIEGLGKAVALSGGGQFEFGRVMNQFIQMAGKGKILQEDLKFMFEAAPKLRGVVNEVFGTSDAEALRDLVTAREFTEKLIQKLHEVPGVAGTVKNDLENIWTSLRVGAGEIGLAILKITSLDGTLAGTAKSIDKFIERIVDFIENNKFLVKSFGAVLAGLAVTGPILKLAGNLKMLAGLVAGLAAQFTRLAANIGKALIESNKFGASGGGKWLARGAKAGGILAAGNMVASAFNEGQAGVNDFDARYTANKANGGVGLGDKLGFGVEAFANMVTSAVAFDFATAGAYGERVIGGGKNVTSGGGGISDAADRVTASLAELAAKAETAASQASNLSGFSWINNAPTDDPSAKKAGGPNFDTWVDPNADGKWGKMFSDGGSGFDFTDYVPDNPFMSGAFGVTGDMGEFSTMSDHPMVKILEQYEQALKDVQAQEAIGLGMQDAIKSKVDATTTAYMAAAEQFGITSEEAQGFAEKLKELQAAQAIQATQAKEQEEQQARTMAWLGTMQSAAEGIGAAFAEIATKGVAGFKALAGAILKAAAAAVKLAVAQWIGGVLADVAKTPGGFLTALPKILAGGAIIGMIDGLMGQVSLAQGGILTGESIIRAGEYPGAAANPEVIAPLDKLKQYMGDTGGMGPGYIVGEVAGDKILLVTSTAQSFAGRRGSGNKIQF